MWWRSDRGPIKFRDASRDTPRENAASTAGGRDVATDNAAPDTTCRRARIIHRLVTDNWYVYWTGSKTSVPANRIV